jgi:hypothetical protein
VSALENTDKTFNILKNFIALIAIAILIWLYLPFFSVLRKELTDSRNHFQLEEFSILSAKFKVTREKLELADQLNTPERTQGKQDLAVSLSAKQAAQLLQAAAPALGAPESTTGEHAWVYVGDLRKDGWHVKNFHIASEPQAGQTITAVNDVFERAGKPVNTGGDNWRLAEIQGVLPKGGKATLKSVYAIDGYGGGKLWWAELAE